MSARSVEFLAPKDAGGLRAFLAQEAAHNMYLLGILEEFGIAPQAGRTFWASYMGMQMKAALFVGGDGGLYLPSASDATEIAAISEKVAARGAPKLRGAMGEKAAVDAL